MEASMHICGRACVLNSFPRSNEAEIFKRQLGVVLRGAFAHFVKKVAVFSADFAAAYFAARCGLNPPTWLLWL